MYAPIVLFVYNRPDHTEKVLESLSKNKLASHSNLYIFSDGPKNNVQKSKVEEVRAIINDEKWSKVFKHLDVIESKTNKGLANSVINGVSNIINKHGRVIVLEDDLVISNVFLNYMNECLSFFEDDDRIWSISGFNIPISIPADYQHDVYMSYRGSSWGWATWKNRWETVDWTVSDYEEFRKDFKKRMSFNRGGNDLSLMLDDQMDGHIDSWAIRWVYSQHKQNQCTIYPVKSLVENIGLDGSGTHSGVSDKYTVELENDKKIILSKVEPDERLLKSFKDNYLSFPRYLIVSMYRKIKRIFKIKTNK